MMIFLVLLINFSFCFYPFSHQYWTCLCLHGDVDECFYNNTDVHLTSGTLGGSSPDAMKSIGLHNLDYAIFQYFYAVDSYNATETFDPVSFSLGYIYHLVEDSIGHNGNRGFINGSNDFELCISIDTYNYYTYFDTKKLFPGKLFTSEAKDFIYDCQIEYNKEYPDVYPKVATKEEVDKGALYIDTVIIGEEFAVKVYSITYKGHLEHDSNCGDESLEDAEAELDLSYQWMKTVTTNVNTWVKETTDIQEIKTNIDNNVNSLFQQHNNTICVN